MVDAIGTVSTLLTGAWISSNTDSITPTIGPIMDYKEIDLGNGDFILIYEVDENITPFGIGGTEWQHIDVVSIDIRTTYKRAKMSDVRAHLTKLKEEVYRIFKANIITPGTGWELTLLNRRRDLSDKSNGLGRMIIDISVKHWGA